MTHTPMNGHTCMVMTDTVKPVRPRVYTHAQFVQSLYVVFSLPRCAEVSGWKDHRESPFLCQEYCTYVHIAQW